MKASPFLTGGEVPSKNNSGKIKHIMWLWGYIFRLYWVIFRSSCTRSIQRMHYALWDPQRLQ